MIKKTFAWIKLIVGASIQFETWWFQNKWGKLNSSQGFSMIFTPQGIFGVRDKKKFRVKLKQSWIFWIRADLELHRRIPATRIAARSVARRPTPTTSLVSAPLHLSPEQMQTCTSRPLWTVSWQAGSPSCQYGRRRRIRQVAGNYKLAFSPRQISNWLHRLLG